MLLRKFIRIFFLVIIFCQKASAQINLQTGSSVFSLPLFSWQDDKSRLKSDVSLNYNSGNGLKVDEVASNVGQGWNLVQGGVITRIQVGEPDDQIAYGGAYPQYGDADITKYPAGFLYHSKDPSLGCPNALTKYPTYGGRNQLYTAHNVTAEDKQLDYFSFQFNGHSGMFVLDTVNGLHGIPLADTKMKITFSVDNTMITQGIRTTITSFTITDVDGLIYKFTKHGYTRVLRASFSDPSGLISWTQPTIKDGQVYYQSGFDTGPTASPWYNSQMANPLIISSWYLSEIDDPFVTSRTITFNYGPYLPLSTSLGADISYNVSAKRYVVISYKKSVTSSLEIQSIVYPDGHTVTFNYAANFRYDFPGEKAIASIDVSYQGRYISRHILNTTYFILNRYGTPSSPYQQSVARLCLKSVQKIGVDLKEDTPPYSFDYYTGSSVGDDIVPPPFSYLKDVWGFYNGTNSLQFNSPLTGATLPVNPNLTYSQLDYNSAVGLCFANTNLTGMYLNAKPNYAQNGLLKEIIYPTGGSTTYTYGQNTGSFMGSSTVNNVGGVHVTQTSSADGGYSNGCATPIVTQYNYVMNGAGSASSLWGLETPKNSITSVNYYKDEHMTLHVSFPLSFTCKWHYLYPGILSQTEAIGLTHWQQIMNAIAPYMAVLSFITDVMDVVNVCLDATPLAIVSVVLDVISSIIGLIFSCPQTVANNTDIVTYNFDLNQVSPLPAQFKRVEITESPGTNGKTVEQFTDGDPNDLPGTIDYGLWSPGSNTAFSAKQRFAPWAYGLPKLITVYNAAGNKIKETENDYDFSPAMEVISHPIGTDCPAHVYTSVTACKCNVLNNYSQRSDNWGNNTMYDVSYLTSSNADMLVDMYNIYTGRVLLSKTLERIYRTTDASQYVETENDYYYNSGDLCSTISNYEISSILSIQSNGDITYKNITYPTDYNHGILATMVQKNIVSLPVATNTSVYRNLTVSYLGEKVTEFTQLSNLDIKPLRTLEQRFATPVTSFTAYSGPTTTNYANYNIPQVFSYDNTTGDLIGVTDEGNRKITNIYDYNDKYIVASVINADPVADKPLYTSFETSGLGGWTMSGSPTYSTTSVITGSRGMIMNGIYLYASPSTLKPYIISFWANINAIILSGGATLSKSGPTYLGMTYYEYNIAQGTSSVQISSGTTCVIDELRMYPATARMRTTTFDPLLGKTSECDENNRITYYTYDNLGRLQFKKDEAGNILKMYEYNSVSSLKQTGCPSTYYNHQVSEIFTRSNCAAGYQGGQVVVSVAANAYTSAVSQLDADIQAEIAILTSGQSTANGTGSCSQIFYSAALSTSNLSQICPAGQKGALVTYTVPYGRYTSIISQLDANAQAAADTAANGIAYSNSPFHSSCVIDNNPDWEWFPGDSSGPADPSYCLSVNGQLPPHQFVLATDVNPNSPTYKQTQYVDYGTSSACAANTYFNPIEIQSFTRNNCTSGYTGSAVSDTVQPGTFSSTVNQATATQLAINYLSANGQNYANTHGTCTVPLVINGTAYFGSSHASGSGTITGPVGYTVTVTVSASGPPGGTYNIYSGITGATTTGQTSATNGSASYTFVMPSSGSVTWSVTYTYSDNNGSGSIGVH